MLNLHHGYSAGNANLGLASENRQDMPERERKYASLVGEYAGTTSRSVVAPTSADLMLPSLVGVEATLPWYEVAENQGWKDSFLPAPAAKELAAFLLPYVKAFCPGLAQEEVPADATPEMVVTSMLDAVKSSLGNTYNGFSVRQDNSGFCITASSVLADIEEYRLYGLRIDRILSAAANHSERLRVAVLSTLKLLNKSFCLSSTIEDFSEYHEEYLLEEVEMDDDEYAKERLEAFLESRNEFKKIMLEITNAPYSVEEIRREVAAGELPAEWVAWMRRVLFVCQYPIDINEFSHTGGGAALCRALGFPDIADFVVDEKWLIENGEDQRIVEDDFYDDALPMTDVLVMCTENIEEEWLERLNEINQSFGGTYVPTIRLCSVSPEHLKMFAEMNALKDEFWYNFGEVFEYEGLLGSAEG